MTHQYKNHFYWLVFLTLFVALDGHAQSTAAQRPKVALIIGNADYAIGQLTNPVNDATDIAEKLESFGFHVTLLRNAAQEQMEEAVLAFSRRLARDENTVGLFYFAGHGIEVARQNYLIPVNAKLRSESDVKYKAMNAGWLLDNMMNAGNNLNLVILDACRNNPFTRSVRSAGRGLADMNPARGTMVFYATEPGKVARDGSGRNGVFTEHLLAAMDEPGLSVDQVFNRTAMNVDEVTEGEQTPWKEGVVLGIFAFNAAAPEPPDAPATPTSTAPAGSPPPLPLSLTGQLQINVNTPNSQVTVNGIPRGVAGPGNPLNITGLPVGKLTIQVASAGHRPQAKTIDIQAGQWSQEVFWLQPAQSATARLTVRSNVYRDRVKIDGRDYGSTRLDLELPPGQHTVQVSKAGHDTWRRDIQLAAGEQRTLHARLERLSGPAPLAAAVQTRPLTDASALEPKLLRIEGGCFQMGSPADEQERDDDEAQHEVCVGSFSIAAHETTQAQWQAIMGANPSHFSGCRTCPVENISWNAVQDYLRALNDKTGKRYRLPTEAEWEYAARAGRGGPFSFRGKIHTGKVNYNGTFTYAGGPKGEYRKKTLPVGSMLPNRWGLTEVHGNVREWTCSAYTPQYQGLETECVATGGNGQRSIRGASWFNIPRYARSANRYGDVPGFADNTIGFRVAHD